MSAKTVKRGSLAGMKALGVTFKLGAEAGGLYMRPCVALGFMLNADLTGLYKLVGLLSYGKFLMEYFLTAFHMTREFLRG